MGEVLNVKEFDPHDMPLSCTWIIIAPPAQGKCLKKGTLVKKFGGTVVPVENIQEGDELMGDDDTPRLVKRLGKGTDKLYRVSYLDTTLAEKYGAKSYEVNQEHVLCVKRKVTPSITLDSPGVFRVDYYETENKPIKYFGDLESTERFLSNLKREDYVDYLYAEVTVKDWVGIIGEHLTSLGYGGYLKVGTFETDPIPITVEPTTNGEYYGFTIDGNGRFVLGDGTVTHNTTFMENMAYHLKHRYPVARVFIGTEENYKHFCKVFHPLYVSSYWDEEEERNHIKRQKTCVFENGKNYPGNYAVNIIDDISDDPKAYKSKIMRGLFKLGSQHWAQLLMIGLQYAIDMPTDVRKCVSYVALGREPEKKERLKLYENFGGLAGSFEMFNLLMDKITGDYTFLIFKKRSQSNNLEDCLFWYRTKKLGKWRFGCKEYREWADKRYDPNYVEEVEY